MHIHEHPTVAAVLDREFTFDTPGEQHAFLTGIAFASDIIAAVAQVRHERGELDAGALQSMAKTTLRTAYVENRPERR